MSGKLTLGVAKGRWVRDRHKLGSRGANLVEFAVLAPLLILLLFGIIEFAWVFSINLDIRHGAREGARLAATDDLTPGAEVADICDRMDVANDPQTEISITRTGDAIGDDITVTVESPVRTLTGIFNPFLSPSTQLNSTIIIRQEQVPSWSQIGSLTACP